MDRLRIAVALPHLGVYGGIRRFLELGNVWAGRGHDVALLLPQQATAREPWIPFRGRVGDLGELPALGADVLLSPEPALFLSADAPGALRVFYSVLEGAPGDRDAARSADLVLANSRGLVRTWARRRVAAEPAPGGVDFSRFHPPARDLRPERARIGEPVRALVYGRLSRRRKGSWTAVRAVEAASRATGVAVTLTLFDARTGPGEEPRELPRRLAIPHRWVHDPTQADLAALYGDADLFVSAERRAGWCNTAAEAMACGAAVACTRSGTEDFAENGATARVARHPWTWLLARAIAPLLRDPAARAELAARGRERIAQFSWERTASRIEALVLERLGSRWPPESGGRRIA
jgi:glycosyltransferase involved in cell wall biosynthesis